MRKDISIMIKPASASCQLDCSYCFYKDLLETSGRKNLDFMDEKTSLAIIDKALAYGENSNIYFNFQGGEPTLAGLDFFKFFSQEVKKRNKTSKIYYGLQTNGLLLDQDWLDWLEEEDVLLGISLDGLAPIHDKYRTYKGARGSYHEVVSKIEEVKKRKIRFNILTVVTEDLARRPQEVYENYRKKGYNYLQFIPLIEGMDGKKQEGSLERGSYGRFLVDLYRLWSKDLEEGNYVSIRFFDNLYQILEGHEPSACEMRGHCSIQNIIEANGDVYPCDYYAYGKYLLGNIKTSDFDDLIFNERTKSFIKDSLSVEEKCQTCPYLSLCRGGCKRYRLVGENLLCEDFKYFYNFLYNK